MHVGGLPINNRQAAKTLYDHEICSRNFKELFHLQNYVFPLEKVPTELIVLEDEPNAIGVARKLRKSYLWSKKIRLAVYKIITYLPKLISGNYKKKVNGNNEI